MKFLAKHGPLYRLSALPAIGLLTMISHPLYTAIDVRAACASLTPQAIRAYGQMGYRWRCWAWIYNLILGFGLFLQRRVLLYCFNNSLSRPLSILLMSFA